VLVRLVSRRHRSIDQRRDELGLLALRGSPTLLRWLMPSWNWRSRCCWVVPGYLLGYWGIRLFAHAPLQADATSTWFALLAIAGALLAGVLAQARALSSSVVSLLRGCVAIGAPPR